VEAAAATSPALFYPGYLGGGIFHAGKLCCTRTVCPKNWRSSCNGLKTAACRNRHCQTVTAPDGSVCDVNPCVQGLCWKGVCVGGGPATCPAHPEECKQVSLLNIGFMLRVFAAVLRPSMRHTRTTR
jgi:hypothetical protein